MSQQTDNCCDTTISYSSLIEPVLFDTGEAAIPCESVRALLQGGPGDSASHHLGSL